MTTKGKKNDIHPQYFRMPVALAPDTGNPIEVNKPTPVVSNIGTNRSLVMELLKVMAAISPPPIQDADENSIQFSLNDRANAGVLEWDDPGCIVHDAHHVQVLDSAATDGTVAVDLGFRTRFYDLTDGAGNGPIFAGPALYLVAQNDASLATDTPVWMAILFRMVEVSAQEYAQALAFP